MLVDAGSASVPAPTAELLLAELKVPDDVTLPDDVPLPDDITVPAVVPAAAAGRDALDPAAVPVMPYAPFYGGPYVPLPATGRHLARS